MVAANKPPETSRNQAASGLLAKLASTAAGNRPGIGSGSSPSAKKSDLVAAGRRSVGVNAEEAPGAGDLCLGMAVGISPAQLVTFVASFREVSPLADLVLFFEAPTSERFNDIIDK